jgi:hypothetical protein
MLFATLPETRTLAPHNERGKHSAPGSDGKATQKILFSGICSSCG